MKILAILMTFGFGMFGWGNRSNEADALERGFTQEEKIQYVEEQKESKGISDEELQYLRETAVDRYEDCLENGPHNHDGMGHGYGRGNGYRHSGNSGNGQTSGNYGQRQGRGGCHR